MHDQSEDISIECAHLEESLRLLGFDNHCVHTGPLIRGEQEYRTVNISVRKQILKRVKTFYKHVNIKCKSFYIEKKHIQDEIEAVGKLSKQISVR